MPCFIPDHDTLHKAALSSLSRSVVIAIPPFILINAASQDANLGSAALEQLISYYYIFLLVIQ